jgi:predicted AAA+ superfamily ATPase
MANLRPWYKVVDPRLDLRKDRRLDESEFAVHLDQIREGRAREDYQNPERFFERTYLTKTLKDLAVQVMRRLSGQSVETSAVFNMATQFGGGKTHALALLYHLAQGGPAANDWSGVRDVLRLAGVAGVPKANLAVFVGQQFDPLVGRSANGEPMRKTPWAEIAWQLGGAKSLKVVAEHDERGIAPGGDAIRAFLPDGPCLILMDEVLNYMSRFRKAASGEGSQFLQLPSESLRGSPVKNGRSAGRFDP